MLHDLRHAFRALRKTPLFAAIAIATIAVGVGANTAIVSVIDSLLLRPPHFPHVGRLVYIVDTNPEKVPAGVEPGPSPGNVFDWRSARSFDRIVMWRNWYFSVRQATSPDVPTSVRGVRVSTAFFSMLGVQPALGRTFHDEEGVAGRDDVAVLSHGLWRRQFSEDPAIVGRQILVDARPRTVIGVLPKDFQFYQPDLDLWMPLPEATLRDDRRSHSVMVFARLAHNVTREQAQADLDRITARLAAEHPDSNAGWGARILPLFPSKDVRDVRPALMVLLVASGFVLLIACANVANLLLVRGFGRQREMAVRTAIGASRFRLVRQVLTESVLVAAVGGLLGVVVARGGIALLVPLMPHAGTNQGLGTFGPLIPQMDLRVLAFSTTLAVGTGLLFGLVPALQATRLETLRVAASASRRSGAGRVLMLAELTLAIVLLAGAALLIKSFWRLQQINPGFRSSNLLTMQLWLPKTKYPEPDHIRRFFDQVLPRLRRLPGVRDAGAVTFRPFLGMAMLTRIDVPGRPITDATDDIFVGYNIVTPGYLRLLGERLIRGRDLQDSDDDKAMGAAVVNEAMARRLWPNADPIGKQFRPAFTRTDVPWAVDVTGRTVTVVGLAADIKEFQLSEQTRPVAYLSYKQFPSGFMYVMARTDVTPEVLAPSLEREILAVDPDQPVSNIRTMDDAIAQAAPRFNVALLIVFGGVATLLSMIGVYGVTAYGVTQRTREIGIRMALGASARGMLALVMRETVMAAAVAGVLGVAGALALTRAMANLLYGVSATDAGAMTAAVTVLFVSALVASYIPARRAATVSPIVALKSDAE